MIKTIISTHSVLPIQGKFDINPLVKKIYEALVATGIDKNSGNTDAFNFGGQDFEKYYRSFPSMISTGAQAHVVKYDLEIVPADNNDVAVMEVDLADHDLYLADALQLVERLILDGCFEKGNTCLNFPLKEKPKGYESSEIRYRLYTFRNLHGNFFVDIAMHFCTMGMVDGSLLGKDEENVLYYVVAS